MFLDIGFPKVEWDKNATFGSKPNKRATLTQDFETLTNLSGEGKSWTFVSATRIVLLSR